MKGLVWVLALFAFLKGPELYSKFIDVKHKKVKTSINKLYGNDPLAEVGIQFPDVVRAQIYLETRKLTSPIYKKNGNMFGMKESSRKWDCGTQRGHANYNCPEDEGLVCTKHCTNVSYMKLAPRLRSLLDYRDWQLMRFEQARKRGMKVPTTNEEYIYFLQHLPGGGAYAEDPLYSNKLQHIIDL